MIIWLHIWFVAIFEGLNQFCFNTPYINCVHYMTCGQWAPRKYLRHGWIIIFYNLLCCVISICSLLFANRSSSTFIFKYCYMTCLCEKLPVLNFQKGLSFYKPFKIQSHATLHTDIKCDLNIKRHPHLITAITREYESLLNLFNIFKEDI